MLPLEQRLTRLAEQRPPVGAGALIHRIESQIAEGPVRRMSPAVHPIRAMALAATAMLVFVGGVAVGHWAFGRVGLFDMAFSRGGGWGTSADVNALAFVVAGAGGGAVLLLGALNLAWSWRRRRTADRSSADRGGVMETIERNTQTQVSIEKTDRTNRWLAIGLVLALAALAGLGAWLLIDNLVKTDYETLIEDHHAAFNAGEASAVAAMYTEDAVYVDGSGREYQGRAGVAETVETMARYEFRLEITGDITTFGSFASIPERVTLSWGTFEGISVVEFEGPLIKRFVAVATQVFD